MYAFSKKTSPDYQSDNFWNTEGWKWFLKNNCIQSSLIECYSFFFFDRKIKKKPKYRVLMVLHDVVHSSQSFQDPCDFLSPGSTGRKNTVCLLLEF